MKYSSLKSACQIKSMRGITISGPYPLFFGRIQLLGDLDSKSALSIGLKGIALKIYNDKISIVQMPLFFSTKTSESLEWFFNPQLSFLQVGNSKYGNTKSSSFNVSLNTGAQYKITPSAYFNIAVAMGYTKTKDTSAWTLLGDNQLFYWNIGIGVTARFGLSRRRTSPGSQQSKRYLN